MFVKHKHASHCSALEQYRIKRSGLERTGPFGQEKVTGQTHTWVCSFQSGKEKEREAEQEEGNLTSV